MKNIQVYDAVSTYTRLNSWFRPGCDPCNGVCVFKLGRDTL